VKGLAVRGLRVSFGGLVAVTDVSLLAPVGRITGLIGPNGAGKTTTFNACSGLIRPDAGSIVLDGRDVTRISAARRARLGLGRTFQRMELFEGLTVRQNVEMGWEAARADSAPWRHVFAGRSEVVRMRDATEAALDLCKIGELADRSVSSLSTGQRRLVELARVLAGGFHVLLLDEPSSGLDAAETTAFGKILERVIHERGAAILLVEHDMSIVMDICAYVYVLDFGRLVFEGTPEQVANSDVVRSAYLGASAR
jgi:ABC-type branched-subunit amino acid transport system ATPase component